MTQITDEMKVAAVKAYTEVDGKCRPAAMQKALEAALPFLPIAVEEKVKALEWEDAKDKGYSQANCALGQYQVSWLGEFENWQCCRPHRAGLDWKDNFSRHPSKDEAKAAAQADYETRIHSALISSPGKDGGQEVEPVADRGEPCPHCKGEGCQTGDPEGAPLEACDNCNGSGKKISTQPASTALVERLTSALQPFAQAADDIERTYGNDLPEWQIQFPQLPMSDFRRARAALASSTSREGER